MTPHIEYIGKKLVKANEALGQYTGKFYYTLDIRYSDTGQDTAAQQMAQVVKNLEMDAWCQVELGYGAFSLLPSDDGTWFKFKTKADAMRFKVQFG